MTSTSGSHPAPTLIPIPPPGRYVVDVSASSVQLAVTHMFGAGTVRATMRLREGSFLVEDHVALSTATAVLDVASFHSGNRLRDRKVKGPGLLDAAHHPDLSFHGERMRLADDGCWLLRGALTVRGGSGPVDIRITQVHRERELRQITASAVIDRLDFGVIGSRGMVGQRVEIQLSLVARAA